MRRITKLLPVLMAVTIFSTGCSLGTAAKVVKVAYDIASADKETSSDSATEASSQEETNNEGHLMPEEPIESDDSAADSASVEIPDEAETSEEPNDSYDTEEPAPSTSAGTRIGANAYTGYDGIYNTIVQTSDENLNKFKTLENDVTKIKWFYIGTLEGEDNIIVSYAPFYDGYYYHYLIALTNLYPYSVDVSMEGYAEDASGNNIGTIYMDQYGVGTTSTYVYDLYLDDMPSGILNITGLEVSEPHANFVYWEADWSLGMDDTNSLALSYNIYSAETMAPGFISGILLDADGYIINSVRDYIIDPVTSYSGEMSFYQSEFYREPKDVAFFANPTDMY